jgi:serine/threonine-protein kinase
LGKEGPNTLKAMNDIAWLYCMQGRYEQAESMFVETLESRRRVLGKEHPDTQMSMNNLAWFQATCPEAEFRNGAKAIEYATKACELTDWKKAMYVDALAAAYAEAGDFDSAVKQQKKAIDLMTEGEEHLRADFKERLRLYQSGKPYRESP